MVSVKTGACLGGRVPSCKENEERAIPNQSDKGLGANPAVPRVVLKWLCAG